MHKKFTVTNVTLLKCYWNAVITASVISWHATNRNG